MNQVTQILNQYVPAKVQAIFDRECRIRVLAPGETYAQASGVVSMYAPDLPDTLAGLFVLDERTAYLREVTPASVLHEYGHGIDAMLGLFDYCSFERRDLIAEFDSATRFVSEYAAEAQDEWFAEGFRFYFQSKGHRAKLAEVAPTLHHFFRQVFTQ